MRQSGDFFAHSRSCVDIRYFGESRKTLKASALLHIESFSIIQRSVFIAIELYAYFSSGNLKRQLSSPTKELLKVKRILTLIAAAIMLLTGLSPVASASTDGHGGGDTSCTAATSTSLVVGPTRRA